MGDAQKIVKFGTFEVDLAAAELRKQGLKLRLQEQPFQVLAALLENPGEVVTREDLIARLWPDGTVVDFDRGLNAAVTRLRQVLSDSAETPRYVETVARRGYRFIAPVEAEGCEIAEAFEITPVVPVNRRSWMWPLVAAFVLVGIVSIGWFVLRNSRSSNGPLTVVPLTTEVGYESGPSFSPDGSQVAFTWSKDGGWARVYLKVVGSGDPVRLTSTNLGEFGPAWSPDGRQIAFHRYVSQGLLGVFVIPALGGVERKVAEFHYMGGAGLGWMPDSRHLVVNGAAAPNIRESLFLVDISSGEKIKLTNPQEDPDSTLYADGEPAVSPDGRTIAFTRGKYLIDEAIHLLQLSDSLRPVGKVKRLTFGMRSVSPAWTPDGREIVFVSGVQLAIIGMDKGAKTQELTSLGTGLFRPTISKTGRLAFSKATRDNNIWRLDIAAYNDSKQPPVQLIASTADDQNGQYSSDGNRIALQSKRSGVMEIWVCESNGTHCVQLTNFNKADVNTGSPHWSPDGKWIAFDSNLDGHWNIYLIGSNGGPIRRVTDNSSRDTSPNWSRDGKWIYFASERTGRGEVWKAPSSGGAAIQVTRTGGFTAFESPDGKWLYYNKSEYSGPVSRSALDGSGEIEVLKFLRWRAFVVGDEDLYYLKFETGGGSSLRRFRLATSQDSEIMKIEKPTQLGLSRSPDGKYLIYTQTDSQGSDLMMVEHFR